MRINGLIFFTVIMLVLSGCQQSESVTSGGSADENSFAFENSETGQSFEVIHAYQLFNPFYEESKNISNEDHFDLYKSSVIDPVYDKCFKNGEYLDAANSLLNEEPKNRIAIQDVIKKIKYDAANEAIKDALIKSFDLLPTEKETTVCIFPTNESTNLMLTVGSGKIIVLYNRNYTTDTMKAGIARAYFHSYWTEKHFGESASTVLDDLVLNGKAVFFEKTVYPQINLTKIDESFPKEQWAKVEGDLASEDPERAALILKGGKEGFPKNYGYSEGYKMVKAYVDANPDLSVEEWSEASASDILEQGKYLENYN